MCYTSCMSQERARHLELDPELVRAFASSFIPRWDTYSKQLPDGSYVRLLSQGRTAKPLSMAQVEGHLKGLLTLGAYMLAPDSTTDKICFDADDDQGFTALRGLAQSMAQEYVPSYLELSRRGGHLWLFTPSLSGQEARRFGKQLLAEQSIEAMELYPKQAALTASTPVGSLVRLPLGINQAARPPRRFHFVNLEGSPLAGSVPDYLSLLATPERVPQDFVDHVLARAPEPRPVFRLNKRFAGETPSERIKAAIPVADFVGQFVELTPAGRGYCPFHDDQRISFSVQRQENYWHCFAGCGGGSIIDFWMQWRALQGQSTEFSEVIKDLFGLLEL